MTAGGVVGFESPPERRADRVFIDSVRLPYWRFPRNPSNNHSFARMTSGMLIISGVPGFGFSRAARSNSRAVTLPQ